MYQSASVYDYLKVPAHIVKKFSEAKSKGTFLNKIIKPRFKYTRVQ